MIATVLAGLVILVLVFAWGLVGVRRDLDARRDQESVEDFDAFRKGLRR